MATHDSKLTDATQEHALSAGQAHLVERFRADGVIQLRDVVPRELVCLMRDAFLKDHASPPTPEAMNGVLEVGDRRFMFPVDISGPFTDPAVYAAPIVISAMRSLLGSDCVIQSYGAVCAYPGSAAQHLHRDHPGLFPDVPNLDTIFPPYAVTFVIPLVNLTKLSGTTAIWPGTHRMTEEQFKLSKSEQEIERLDGAVLPYCSTGDGYLMDGRVRHRGLPNASEAPRPLLYLVYSRPWWLDAVNFRRYAPMQMSRPERARIPSEYASLFRRVDGGT